MKRPELEMKDKLSFGSLEELVYYCLKYDVKLGYIELDCIFNDIVYKNARDKFFNPNYKKLCDAIKYLLKNLENEQLDSLINVINADFEFEMEFCINSDFYSKNFLGDEFAGYSYTCTNPETARFLIELAKKLKTKEKNASLDEFKNSFNL